MKTKKWAKQLSLEVWEYLRDHPEIKRKEDLPDELYDKINFLYHQCPLCYYLNKYSRLCDYCFECPLQDCGQDSYFYLHGNAESNEERAKYAGLIVDKIKAWDIDN